MTDLVIGGGLGTLATVVGLFVRAIILAGRVTNDQHNEWRKIVEEKDQRIRDLEASNDRKEDIIRDLQKRLYPAPRRGDKTT